MYRLRMESCLLLSSALLAGCSEGNTPTAPAARPLAATAAVERPYTWSLACKGTYSVHVYASWDWTYTDASGTVTVIPGYGGSGIFCPPDQNNRGVRPAQANGFRATVGDRSDSWSFDPAGSFKAQLKGSASSFNLQDPRCDPLSRNNPGVCYTLKETGTVSVGS